MPAAALDENKKVIRDRYGNPVHSGLYTIGEGDTTTLQKIAEITGGKFYRVRTLDQLKEVYREIDKLEKTPVKLRNFTSYIELFQYFAAAALAVLALKLALSNTRYRILP